MARGPHLPLRPIAVRDRASILFLEYGQVDVIDGAFVLVDQQGVRVQIPVGGLACLMLEPGIRITHAAVALAARVGCLLVWVGEGAVRLYSAGQPGGARADRLLYQARCALDDTARLNVFPARAGMNRSKPPSTPTKACVRRARRAGDRGAAERARPGGVSVSEARRQ